MKILSTAILPLLLLGISACSSPEVQFQSESFPFQTILDNRLAMGGIVLHDRLVFVDENELDFSGGPVEPYRESDRWSHHLERGFLVKAPDLDRWPWATVADQVDPVLMTEILRVYKRGGFLNEQKLLILAESLPGSRFLLLARIDENDLGLESNLPVSQMNAFNSSGLGKTPSSQGPIQPGRGSHFHRRSIRLSMDLFDLASGRSIWSASVARHRDQPLDSLSGGEPPSVRVQKAPDMEGGVQIQGRGGLSGGPTLDEVLPDACEALVLELLALTGQ